MPRIYTRTGDKGETGLFGGGRVPKSNPRVHAYGEVDELNAVLGWAITLAQEPGLADRLREVQADLLTLGAYLATPPGSASRQHLPELPVAQVQRFERWIDEIEEEVGPLKSFVLPGGTGLAAALHVARTVCRRAERAVVEVAEQGETEPAILVYLNRLSDLLFELARHANHRAGVHDTPWRPRE